MSSISHDSSSWSLWITWDSPFFASSSLRSSLSLCLHKLSANIGRSSCCLMCKQWKSLVPTSCSHVIMGTWCDLYVFFIDLFSVFTILSAKGCTVGDQLHYFWCWHVLTVLLWAVYKALKLSPKDMHEILIRWTVKSSEWIWKAFCKCSSKYQLLTIIHNVPA